MHLSIHIVIYPTCRTHLENSFESVEKPFARKHLSSINHLISTAKHTQNPFEPPIENKINQFHHIHICINLKKSIQDIRNKKSITLLTQNSTLNTILQLKEVYIIRIFKVQALQKPQTTGQGKRENANIKTIKTKSNKHVVLKSNYKWVIITTYQMFLSPNFQRKHFD